MTNPIPYNAAPINAARLDMALAFETLSDGALDSVLRAAVLEHGGTLILPRDTWGPVECELSLLGICATGDTPAAAARSWTKRCLRAWNATTTEDAA